jgi:hypothetical protein
MSTDTLEDLEILIQENDFVKCESVPHTDWPDHEAHYNAVGPCDMGLPVCERRRTSCRMVDGWQCTYGCTGWHPYAHIRWYPL